MSSEELENSVFAHMLKTDGRTLESLRAASGAPPEALDLFCHLVAAERLWLDRIEGRAQGLAVWPALTLEQSAAALSDVHAGWQSLLSALDEARLDAPVAYANSAGQTFETPLVDVLAHVAHHGSYHRGQIAARLRAAGHEPSPTDLIGFARGVDAARTERDAPGPADAPRG